LILIPTESPDYKELVKYNEIIHEKNYVKVKDLVLGGTYKTKSNEEYIYMGRFDYYDNKYESVPYEINNYYGTTTRYNTIKKIVNKGKHHYFVAKYDDNRYFSILALKSLGERFIEIISSECVENYADLFDKLEYNSRYSPIDESKDEYIPYTFEEFNKKLSNHMWSFYFYDSQKNYLSVDYSYKKSKEDEQKYYYQDRNNYNKSQELSFEEIFNQTQPMYKNTYLTNGKLYSEGK